MDSRKGNYEEKKRERQEKIKEMNLLNVIDRNIDEEAKEQEIKLKLETLIDYKLKELESNVYFHLKHFFNEKTDKYNKKQSTQSIIDDIKKIEYLNKRLDMVENDINRIYNSYEFEEKMINFDKYEKYLKIDSEIKDIKRRMKIILLKSYELDDYYSEYLYDPHK